MKIKFIGFMLVLSLWCGACSPKRHMRIKIYSKHGAPVSGAQVFLGNQILGKTNDTGSIHVESPFGFAYDIRVKGQDDYLPYAGTHKPPIPLVGLFENHPWEISVVLVPLIPKSVPPLDVPGNPEAAKLEKEEPIEEWDLPLEDITSVTENTFSQETKTEGKSSLNSEIPKEGPRSSVQKTVENKDFEKKKNFFNRIELEISIGVSPLVMAQIGVANTHNGWLHFQGHTNDKGRFSLQWPALYPVDTLVLLHEKLGAQSRPLPGGQHFHWRFPERVIPGGFVVEKSYGITKGLEKIKLLGPQNQLCDISSASGLIAPRGVCALDGFRGLTVVNAKGEQAAWKPAIIEMKSNDHYHKPRIGFYAFEESLWKQGLPRRFVRALWAIIAQASEIRPVFPQEIIKVVDEGEWMHLTQSGWANHYLGGLVDVGLTFYWKSDSIEFKVVDALGHTLLEKTQPLSQDKPPEMMARDVWNTLKTVFPINTYLTKKPKTKDL